MAATLSGTTILSSRHVGSGRGPVPNANAWHDRRVLPRIVIDHCMDRRLGLGRSNAFCRGVLGAEVDNASHATMASHGWRMLQRPTVATDLTVRV
jgi:hypothetical protein